MQRFCASLKDGHTNVYFPESIDSLIYTTYFGDYRLFLEEIDGKAVVVRTNYSKKDEIPVGTEIIEVNGIPTQAYADQYVKPYISSSTQHVLEKQSITWLLRSPVGTTYQLTFKKPDGSVFERELTHERVDEKEVYPTVLLIGNQTASAAEDFLIAADNQPHMTKIGAPSYGSTGQPLFFELPGGGSARVCTKQDTYPDGRAFVGVGVLPDIEVHKSVEDFIAGIDPVLERAIEYLEKGR